MRSPHDAARSGRPPSANRLTQSGVPAGFTGQWQPALSPAAELLDGLFTGKTASLREAYVSITGDSRVTGRAENVNFDRMAVMTRFAEAVDTSTFANLLGDAIGRRVVEEYAHIGAQFNVWRKVARTVPVKDFRTQSLVRMGGYAGGLPEVSEGAPYLALTTPGDESATYALSKRGGIETITLEAISKNDVDLVRQIVSRLARSARRTLNSFVLDLIRTNANIYDGVPLFHASHGNLGASALSAVSLHAAWIAMQRQTELGSGERLMLRGKYLLVPVDLEEAAFNMLQRNTNNDRFFIQQQGIEVVPVPEWTDANDWVLAADPAVSAGIEVGFFNGQQEPEIVVADAPSSGSLFTHDKIDLKIRHIYGGTVDDYRPLYKSVVA